MIKEFPDLLTCKPPILQKPRLSGPLTEVLRFFMAKFFFADASGTGIPVHFLCQQGRLDQVVADTFFPQFPGYPGRPIAFLDTVMDNCIGKALITLQTFLF